MRPEHARTDDPWTVAGCMPGTAVRFVVALFVLVAGGWPVLPLAAMYLGDPQPDPAITNTLVLLLIFLSGSLLLIFGFRSQTAIDLGQRTLTTSWSVFGVGRSRTWPLHVFQLVQIDRHFFKKIQFSRVRFGVQLLGETPDGAPIRMSLGSYRTWACARHLAERLGDVLRCPVDYVDNATIGHMRTMLVNRMLAPFRLALWPERFARSALSRIVGGSAAAKAKGSDASPASRP